MDHRERPALSGRVGLTTPRALALPLLSPGLVRPFTANMPFIGDVGREDEGSAQGGWRYWAGATDSIVRESFFHFECVLFFGFAWVCGQVSTICFKGEEVGRGYCLDEVAVFGWHIGRRVEKMGTCKVEKATFSKDLGREVDAAQA